VRPLLVVHPDEVVEALLLLEAVEGGGLGGLLFQGQVDALVAAVLFGVARLDALQADAKT